MRASRGIGGATMISSIGVNTYETYNATKKAIKKYRKRKKKLEQLWLTLTMERVSYSVERIWEPIYEIY